MVRLTNSLQRVPLSGPIPYTVAHSLADKLKSCGQPHITRTLTVPLNPFLSFLISPCHTVTRHLLAPHTTSEACPHIGVGSTTSGRQDHSIACLSRRHPGLPIGHTVAPASQSRCRRRRRLGVPIRPAEDLETGDLGDPRRIREGDGSLGR